MTIPLVKTVRAAKFLVIGPLVLGLLVIINLLTSPGHWWVQWPALGIGIAWVVCLIRVAYAIVVLGGLAAFVLYVRKATADQDGAVTNFKVPDREGVDRPPGNG
jgi:hypothetical protein